jgi:tRNA-splicing ligase RtcB (3'-phosphate/5'-hydroxy nucleic acid ligase)
VHWGYGFPIGGVAATDIDDRGVVSARGVGFDISCGVRLLVSGELDRDRLRPRLRAVMDHLDAAIARGVGTKGVWQLPDRAALHDVLTGGARFAVERGHGTARDLERCEDGGVLAGADAADVSDQALERGLGQIGSLGSGNHFLEVQAVDTIYDASAAAHLGLEEGTVCVMIHTGSRGLGHQICTDHVRVMGNAMGRYGIHVPDRQLACVPVRSPEGQAYLAAMAAAANYGRANRQLLTEATRRVFEQHTATSLDLLYDVSHNLAKIEVHDVDGRPRSVCVHRKGATRSLPPHHADLPADLAAIGQPVLIRSSPWCGDGLGC